MVGADFHTILDPTFDRRPAADQTFHSSFRSILEDFTESLSLKDVNVSASHNLRIKVTQGWICCMPTNKVHTHSSEHTHTMNTHPEQWTANYVAAPEEQLRVQCFAQGHLFLVLKVERALYIQSPHL